MVKQPVGNSLSQSSKKKDTDIASLSLIFFYLETIEEGEQNEYSFSSLQLF